MNGTWPSLKPGFEILETRVFDSHTAPSLVAFLLARIDEVERFARAALEIEENFTIDGAGYMWAYIDTLGGHSFRPGVPTPANVVAECEAKRLIVEHWDNECTSLDPVVSRFLELLALPYADHPDYREEWRPA